MPSTIDIQSVYYVQSTEISIKFTVQRFIKDNDQYPFRAFALNDAYQISLSTALMATQELQLSDPKIEQHQREHFIQVVKQKEVEYWLKEQEKQQTIQTSVNSYNNKKRLTTEGYSRTEFRPRNVKVNNYIDKNQVLEAGELRNAILSYIRNYPVISAIELSEYLVTECGASPETFSTGRYKIYIDVCKNLDMLEGEGLIEFIEKDFVNDRVYKVVQTAYTAFIKKLPTN